MYHSIYKKPNANLIIITERIFYNFSQCNVRKANIPPPEQLITVKNQRCKMNFDMYDVLLVNHGNDCLIIKIIRSPCPSSDQRRKVSKVLRQAGVPHTRRTMSLFVLYSRFLQILCCITTIQQHQTKIFRRPILRRMPIQTPIQFGSLKFFY